MLKLLLIVLLVYAVIVAAAALLQTRLLFPAFAVGRSGLLPASAQRLSIGTADGERLAGVHIPPTRPSVERLLVVAFPGNAWNAEDAADLLHRLWPQADVIAFHYRGYRPSSGTPSAAALLGDAPMVLRAAKQRVPDARTVAVGFSVGSGVAARLTRGGEVDGAILVTPFDSLRRVANGHYRWLPISLLFRHNMEPAAEVRRTRVPVALISAERDTIIPAERTASMREAIPRLAYERTIAGAGHNDIYSRPEFRQAMDEALGAVLSQAAQLLPPG